MAKKELKEDILSAIELQECRKADLVRKFISKASPLTITRYVDMLEQEGKIVLNMNTKKWWIK